MEKFLLHFAKIVGTPTEASGSWVHTFSPQETEKILKRGHLLAVIGLMEFTGMSEIAAVGKEMISRLHEEYYGDLESSAFHQLQNTLNKVSQEAKEGTEFKLDIGAVGVVDNILYAVVNNGGKLMINRNGEIKPLLDETNTLSGYLQNGDMFLLGTGEFFRLVNEEVLKSALNVQTPEEAVEILAPSIHGQQDGGAAAIVFQVFEAKVLSTPAKPMRIKEKRTFDLGKRWKVRIGNFIERIDEKIKRRIIYLKANKEKSPRSQKTLISVALILLVILTVAVFFGMKQRKNFGLNSQTSALLQQAKAKKEEGEGLLTLNPAKSRQLLLEAQDLLRQIETAGGQSGELTQFKQELEPLLGSVLQERQVEGALFFDLEIIKAGALGNNFILSGEQMIILDKNQNSIYAVGLQDKKSTILAGGEKLPGASFLADLNGSLYVLAEQGFYKANKIPELKIKKDEEWGLILGTAGFTGNLYLLSSGEIWKYSSGEEGFSSKQKWLKEKNDLSQALAMMIDSSIWILTKDGQILKFTRGAKDSFNLTGLTKPISGPVAFYTNADLKNLYLLDKGNSRVVVVNKSGEYQAEYLWSGLGEASDLLVNSDEGQIFLLAGGKIFTINLK
jgi:hypothetical protein